METFSMEPLGAEEMFDANVGGNSNLQNKPVVKLGSTGAEVTQLQNNLKKLGYQVGVVSGIFDMATYEAVGAFQTNNNLTVDGIAGPATLAALINASSPLKECASGGVELNLGDTTPTSTETMDYTVVAGDTLWMLAQKFETTVDEIKILNGLTNDFISIDQVLRIPVNSGGAVEHAMPMNYAEANENATPAPNEWTYTMPMDNNVNIEETPLPIDEVEDATQTDIVERLEEQAPTLNGFNYTVVYGDSLWKIAQRFGTTVAAIKADNNLTTDSLSVGQVLWISQSDGEGRAGMTYTVVAGDTLWLISQKFGTTVERIKELNGLTGNVIQIGQILRIS